MSNTAKRTIIGVIGIPLFLYLIYLGGIYFLVLCLVIQTLCLWEFLKMFENKGIFTLKILTVLISVAIFFLLYFKYYTGMILISLPVFFEIFREINASKSKICNIKVSMINSNC